jgi:hypothetical protein
VVPKRSMRDCDIEQREQCAWPSAPAGRGRWGRGPAARRPSRAPASAQDLSLSGAFPGCVLAGRARDDQLVGPARLTVAVRWGPGLTLRGGTRIARPGHRQAKAIGGAGWRERCVKLDAGLWDSAPAARRVMDAMTDATLQSDLEAAANLYAPDAVIVTPDQGELRGREQIIQYLKEINDAFPITALNRPTNMSRATLRLTKGTLSGRIPRRCPCPPGRAFRQGGKAPRLRYRDGPERGHHQPPVLLRPDGPPWPARVGA